MLDDKDHCKRCGTLLVIFGYCDADGQAHCENFWQAHVMACTKCRQAALEPDLAALA